MSEPEKQGTPPPLLLMGASGGPSWSASQGSNLFMPVPQTDASLFPTDDGGEEDSFVGQSSTPAVPMNYFKPPPSTTTADPFAGVGHHPHPATTSPSAGVNVQPPTAVVPPIGHPVTSSVPPPSALPTFAPVPQVVGGVSSPGMSSTAPTKASANIYRQTGAPKYAPPPPGTYASPSGAPPPTQPLPNPTTAFLPPPFSDGSPPPPPPPTKPSDVGIPTAYLNPGFGTQQAGGVDGGYVPVQHHWFYTKNLDLRQMWVPFSYADSHRLEHAVKSGEASAVVSTDGGRYDVTVESRTRHAVYWEEAETRVRRCSWFYKLDGETKYNPYEEDFSDKLEEAYKQTLTSGEWHKRLEFPGGDSIVMHNPNVIVHFTASSQPDEWGTTSSDQMRPRVLRRGVADINEDIAAGEPAKIDHVVFVVHGIGVTCDLRFRNIVECVDDMRAYSVQMCDSHFKPYQEEGRVGRVEFLPVRWHSALHGDATGVDRRLRAITLGSIGKLRHFTNDTLLDILFYSSPAYAQQIANTVAGEMNRLRQLFLGRNPQFGGHFSVCGHSLGSLILFDLLLNQSDPEKADTPDGGGGVNDIMAPAVADGGLNGVEKVSTGESTPVAETSLTGADLEADEPELTIERALEKLSLDEYKDIFAKEKIDLETLTMCEDQDLKEMGIPLGPRKKLQGFVKLQKHKQKKKSDLAEEKRKKEIEMRLQEELAKQSHQQTDGQLMHGRYPLLRKASSTCVNFVQGPAGIGIPFVDYPQLDFNPLHFFALGSPIAMFLTVRGVDTLGDEFKFPTCPAFFNIFHPFDPVAYRLEPMIVSAYPPKPVLMPHHKGRKRLHLELRESLTRMGADLKQRIIDSVKTTWQTLNSFAMAHRTQAANVEEEVDSALNQIAQEEEKAETESLASSLQEDDILVGNINQGRRIDYVLQEKPIESFNDYLFALASHLCYWESEDTVLMILKEVYSLHGIHPLKAGAESPQRVPMGPPPSMMPPSPSRQYTASVRDFAAASYVRSSAHTGPTSAAGVPPPQGHPIGQFSAPSFSPARPRHAGPYGASSTPALTSQVAPPVAPLGTTGPPPLSGFVRKG